MPATAIDSAIFRDIFGTEAMRQVWSDGNRIQKYLDFEAGLARAAQYSWAETARLTLEAYRELL